MDYKVGDIKADGYKPQVTQREVDGKHMRPYVSTRFFVIRKH